MADEHQTEEYSTVETVEVARETVADADDLLLQLSDLVGECECAQCQKRQNVREELVDVLEADVVDESA